MERQGRLEDVSVRKNLRWFLEEKATGKITFVAGKTGSSPITAVIEFKDGKPTEAQLGMEKGQRALGQILNLPSEGTYKIETEEPAAPPAPPTPVPVPLEEMPTIPGFAAKPAPPPPPSPPTSGTPSETINEILRGLQRRDSNFQASAVISKEGLIVASILPSGVPQDRVAVSAASIVAQAQSATQDLERGNLQDIFIRGEGGYICVAKIKDVAYLLAITKSAAMLGSILLELKKAGDEISKIL